MRAEVWSGSVGEGEEAGSRKQKAGSRKQEAGCRKQDGKEKEKNKRCTGWIVKHLHDRPTD